MIKILKNPFYIYPASFLFVIAVYHLGWSTLFPKLSTTMLVFLAASFLVSISFGVIVDKLKLIKYNRIDQEKLSYKLFVIFVIYLGYLIEFIYSNHVPLIALIRGDLSVSYTEFGIKTFHVVLVTFNSFYIVYLFHLYISTKTKKILILLILCFIPPILIVNRGMVIIGALTCFFVFALSLRKSISFKKVVIIAVVLLGLLYSFGYLGNLRSAKGDPDYIPKQSMATEEFLESNIPKEYYWSYLYLASPLANFQNNVNRTEEAEYNIFKLVLMECFPEIISKRISVLFGAERETHFQVVNWLTVGTVYSKPYSYAKWLGPIIMFIFTVLVIVVSLLLIPKSSRYHITVIAIISTQVFLNTFDNMFTFSGISLQLFYPILFSFFEGKRIVLGSLLNK